MGSPSLVVRLVGALFASSLLIAASGDDGVDVHSLPMDALPVAAAPAESAFIKADPALRTYRVGRESRLARDTPWHGQHL